MLMTVRLVWSALILMTVSGVLAACGDVPSARLGSSPSVREFRREANGICLRFTRKAEAIDASSARQSRVLAKTVPLLEVMIMRLEGLTPPVGERRRFRQLLAVQRQSAREMRRLQRFTALNEPKLLAALKHGRPRIQVPPAEARAYPTRATLDEAMSIPGVARYYQRLDELGRASAKTGRRLVRLTKALRLADCLK
jgi:hypothetical protein